MLTVQKVKQQVLTILDELPSDAWLELMLFLDYLQYKTKQSSVRQTPYKPVALGGLWAGVAITNDSPK